MNFLCPHHPCQLRCVHNNTLNSWKGGFIYTRSMHSASDIILCVCLLGAKKIKKKMMMVMMKNYDGENVHMSDCPCGARKA